MGFQIAFDKATAVAKWLIGKCVKIEIPNAETIGKIRGYREYEAVILAAKRYFEKTKERCPVDLSSQLIGLEGKRVEVVDRYGDKRRFWVGKSTGWIPCHLELARIDSSGGWPVSGTPFQSIKVIQTKGRTRV